MEAPKAIKIEEIAREKKTTGGMATSSSSSIAKPKQQNQCGISTETHSVEADRVSRYKIMLL